MLISFPQFLYFLIQFFVFLSPGFSGCFLVQFVYFLQLVLQSQVFLFLYSIAVFQVVPILLHFESRYSSFALNYSFEIVHLASFS